MAPRVSIILPVFNGANKFLAETVQSILDQTFTDFEFVIIDDGSTDSTYNILALFSEKDTRIKLLRNERNEGLISSLNRALKTAAAQLIARIDCGEIADTGRIDIQYRFLKEHPEYVLVSSRAEWITMRGNLLFTTSFASDDPEIRERLYLKDNVIIHPAVMYRKIDGLFYRECAATAEDYDYWLRLSMHGKFFIVSQPLLKIRLDPGGTTYSKKLLQIKTVDMIHKSFLSRLKNPGAEYGPASVKLNRLENLQQNLFNLFTGYAVRFGEVSRLFYYFFKTLSGLCSPYYMAKLILARCKQITISRDPLFQRYYYLSRSKG